MWFLLKSEITAEMRYIYVLPRPKFVLCNKTDLREVQGMHHAYYIVYINKLKA